MKDMSGDNDYQDYYPTHLRVTGFNIPPWVFYNNESIRDITGPLAKLLDYLSRSMHFTYDILNNSEARFGHGRYDGSRWVGLLGLLVRNAVDFTLVPAGPNPVRFNASRMPLPFAYSDVTILSGHSIGDDPVGVAAFDNMSLAVWACFVGSFLASSVVSWISEGSGSVRFNWGLAESYKYRIWRFFWEFIGCVFSKEIRLPMRKVATRIILAIWLLGGLIITTIIGGDMTASMTIVPPDFTVDSLEDITKPSHVLRPDIMAFSSHLAFVESNCAPLARRIQEMNSTFPMRTLMSLPAFNDIVHQKAVQINDRYTLLSRVKTVCLTDGLRGFYFAKKHISEVPVSIFFNKRLSRKFMEDVNLRMLRVHQYGLPDAWLRGDLVISPTCFSQPHSGEYAPLEVDHVFPAFALWGKGLVLSSICFLLETLWFLCRICYRKYQEGNLPDALVFLSQTRDSLRTTLCRDTSNRKAFEAIISKQHRHRLEAQSKAKSRKPMPLSGKMVSPSDFHRVLCRRTTHFSPDESVVNRESMVEPRRAISSDNVKTCSKKWWQQPQKDQPKKDPIVRYVDTNSFFNY